MRGLIVIGLFLSGFSIAYSATIKGKLLDENREPLTGANVVIDATRSLYALAGLDGSYSIRNVPPGTYTLTVSFIGYQTQQRTITIGDESEAATVDFQMTVDSQVLGEI